MKSSRRPYARPAGLRWLAVVSVSIAAGVLSPGFASAASAAVLEAPTPLDTTQPPGELAPAPATDAAPPPPADAPPPPTDAAPDAPPAAGPPADAGAGEAPAPPPAETPSVVAGPSAEAAPTAAPAPQSAGDVPTVTTPLPVIPDAPESLVAVLTSPDRLTAVGPPPSASVTPVAPDRPSAAVYAPPKAAVVVEARAAKSAAPITNAFSGDPVSSTTFSQPLDSRATVSDVSSTVAPADSGEWLFNDAPTPVQSIAPVSPAPSGSSLLSVLAGYVLPGGTGAPASTLILFIVIGLIVGLAYAGASRFGERIALFGLMGESAGHHLVVRQPG